MIGTPRDQRKLLAIVAHPDDESFVLGATLGKYAREGVAVHVCIVTDGAAGSFDAPPPVSGSSVPLATLRRQELACACEALGAQLHVLRYRDSGMEGSPDNAHPHSLYQADLSSVADDIQRLIATVRPHVVITHDPSGGYFHPDHIKVNHAVMHAWRRLNGSATPEPGREETPAPWMPARLYFSVIPRSQLVWLLRLLRLLGKDPRRFGRNGDIDLSHIGVADENVHVRLDTLKYARIKERASACHRSQRMPGWQGVIPAFVQRRLQRFDHFQQAYPAAAGRHNDLFAGLAGPG